MIDCEIRLKNADILSNHVLAGGGCNIDILCVECTIDIVKPNECTICDVEFQVRLIL